MSTVGFILARGGSVGIPGKNIKLLGGKPLINWTIEAALDSKLDAVYFTTEDAEIAFVARECAYNHPSGSKFGLFMRPKWLAQNHVQSDEVMLAMLRQLQLEGTNPDTLVMLQPTSPFRTAKHINEAIDLYNWQVKEGLHTVVSCHVAEGFYWQIDEWNEGAITPIRHDPVLRQGRQWIPKADKLYKENGACYIVDSVRFSLHRSYRLAPFTLYEMDERDSVDLDTLDDWERAEREIERRRNESA
jgi:CMP-N,N'-diacetyllegionaminic acid synthase